MDKKIIVKLLTSGFSETKKSIDEITNGIPKLKAIFTNGFGGVGILCNKNQFWDIKNIQNRILFIQDINAIKKQNIQDDAYFRILNRIANGDAYGII